VNEVKITSDLHLAWGIPAGLVLRSFYGYPPQPTSPAAVLMGAAGQTLIRTTRRRASWIPLRMPGRMLDFGCGAESCMKRMRAHGWSVEGIEVSARSGSGSSWLRSRQWNAFSRAAAHWTEQTSRADCIGMIAEKV
jgi:hypothetical protein